MKLPDFPKLTHQRMQTMVVLCVGAALMLMMAVALSGPRSGNTVFYTPAEASVLGGVSRAFDRAGSFALVAATVHGMASNINPAPGSCTTDGTQGGLCANTTSRSAIFSAHLPDTVVTVPGQCQRFMWREFCLPPTVTATGMTVTEQCYTGGSGCAPGTSAGGAITLPAGAQLTLELDWLQQQYVGWPNGCKWLCGDKHDWAYFQFLSSCTSDFGLGTSNLTDITSKAPSRLRRSRARPTR